MKRNHIDIQAYNYNLPDNIIAKYPTQHRDTSKLLIVKPNNLSERCFNDLPSLIPAESTLVYNNTRVIHARIKFFKKTGAKIEIFCLTPHSPSDYQLAFEQENSCIWTCMVGNLKKWKTETLELEFEHNNKKLKLFAEKHNSDSNKNQLIKFTWEGNISFAEVLNATGKIPIPPYLNRESENIDSNRYQTVYSQFDGSVAAPTAGLHFTTDVFEKIKSKGAKIQEVTLHVGAGTFQPVKTENAIEHKMHGEQIIVDKQFLLDFIANKGLKIATGTTTMRTLESLYWLGVKASTGDAPAHLLQWDWETLPQNLTLEDSFNHLISYLETEEQEYIAAITEIMIIPGYQFKVVDILITNFHQPKSTLLLLIAAFIGEAWKDVYDYALNNDFRFLSYGDSSILFRN